MVDDRSSLSVIYSYMLRSLFNENGFMGLDQARTIIEDWRIDHMHSRPPDVEVNIKVNKHYQMHHSFAIFPAFRSKSLRARETMSCYDTSLHPVAVNELFFTECSLHNMIYPI